MAKVSAFGQGIRRISTVLQVLGRAPSAGLRLTDVALAADLNKATAHRLLNGLSQVGLVEQDVANGRFHLGPEMFILGSAAVKRYGLNATAHSHLVRLENKTDDTAYVTVRAGLDCVCIDRFEGNYPIKVQTLNIGDRRPLGISAGGLVLLAALSDEELSSVMEANRDRFSNYPMLDIPKLYGLVEATRRQGYAFFDAYVIPEMSSIGVPIRGPDGNVIAAMAIAAISSRLQPERREVLLELMNAEARALEASLSSLTAGPIEPGVPSAVPSLPSPVLGTPSGKRQIAGTGRAKG
jgi:DNA-binding IclR family transcriptional regulator